MTITHVLSRRSVLGLVLGASALSMVSTSAAAASGTDVNPLVAERWKTRPLVIVAPSSTDPVLVKMQDTLQTPANQAAFTDRQMVLYVVVGDRARRNDEWLSAAQAKALRAAVEVANDAPATVMLIGFDGGIKMREPGVIDPRTIFGTIDQMPMRQSRGTAPG